MVEQGKVFQVTSRFQVNLPGQNESASSGNSFPWWVLAGVTLVLGVGGILTATLLHARNDLERPTPFVDTKYGLVFDAGSSKTKATLYEWAGEKEDGTGVVNQVTNCASPGGIASYTNKTVSQPLLDCVSEVAKSVPPGEMPLVPMYLGATAGMRILNISDDKLASSLLEAISLSLTSKGYSLKSIGILSGEDEGLFAWITVNYLKDLLSRNKSLSETAFSIPVPKTVGSMDMGGASLQIVYELSPPQMIEPNLDNSSLKSVRLYGQEYLVASRSFLCFGLDEAYLRYLALLVLDSTEDNSATVIDNPCGPQGMNLNFTAEALFNRPCTKGTLQLLDMNTTFTFVGTNDVDNCKLSVSKLLDENACSQYFTECFKPLTVSPASPFMAFSGFYFASNNLKLKNATMQEFDDAAISICEQPYDNITAGDTVQRKTMMCFHSQYVFHVLSEGFNFTNKSWNNIEFTMKVEGADLGWDLGYMINATNAIPADEPPLPPTIVLDQNVFIVILVVSVLTLVASAVFFALAAWKYRMAKNARV